MLDVLPVEEGLLCEVIAAAETGFGIDAGELPVGVSREEAQHESEHDARPHVAGDGAAVGSSRRRLQLVRDPQERTRRDQRHRINRHARQSERGLHLRLLLSHWRTTLWMETIYALG